MAVEKINLQKASVNIITKEVEESVLLDEIQKIKDENKPKTDKEV